MDGRSDDKGLEVSGLARSEGGPGGGAAKLGVSQQLECAELIALGNRAPQTESFTIASVCDKTYLFVGGERTSTIFVFDITVRRCAHGCT